MANKKTTPKKEILKVGDTVFYNGNKNYLAMNLVFIEIINNDKMGSCEWIDIKSKKKQIAIYHLTHLTKKAPLGPPLGIYVG